MLQLRVFFSRASNENVFEGFDGSNHTLLHAVERQFSGIQLMRLDQLH
jgi:hypothetical protein